MVIYIYIDADYKNCMINVDEQINETGKLHESIFANTNK